MRLELASWQNSWPAACEGRGVGGEGDAGGSCVYTGYYYIVGTVAM